MNDLYLVLKNLTRKWLRFSLTLFAIFIAFVIYGALAAFQSALDAGVDLAADDRLVVVNKVNFTQPLPYAYFNRIKGIEGVEAAAHLNWFGGYYQDPKNAMPMFAASPEELLEVYEEIVLSDDQREAFLRNQQGLIAGKTTAEQYGWKVGDRIPVSSNIFSQTSGGQTWDFDVVGIYEGSDPQFDTISVYFHYDYFNESRSFGRDYLGFIAVRTSDPALNEQVIKAIDDQFANSFFETETVPEEVFNKAFIEQIGNIGLIITSVVGAAFFTILFIVGNTMVLAIRERTNEIAVMKTLGFPAPRIFRMVLSESLILSIMGGALGLGLAFMLLQAANSIPGLPIPQLIMDGEIIAVSLLYMILLGLVTGIIPAVSAMHLNVITALSRK